MTPDERAEADAPWRRRVDEVLVALPFGWSYFLITAVVGFAAGVAGLVQREEVPMAVAALVISPILLGLSLEHRRANRAAGKRWRRRDEGQS